MKYPVLIAAVFSVAASFAKAEDEPRLKSAKDSLNPLIPSSWRGGGSTSSPMQHGTLRQ